jgi:hypothetical protein
LKACADSSQHQRAGDPAGAGGAIAARFENGIQLNGHNGYAKGFARKKQKAAYGRATSFEVIDVESSCEWSPSMITSSAIFGLIERGRFHGPPAHVDLCAVFTTRRKSNKPDLHQSRPAAI